MKGIVLAAISFLFLIAISMGLLRLYRGQKYYRVLLVAFLLAAGLYVWLHRFLPADLGCLPSGWLEPQSALDGINGFLILGLLFHGYWDAIYTTVLTGFSSNLMILLSRHGKLSQADLKAFYGGADPVDYVVSWRLENLVREGYISQSADGYQLLPKGRVVGVLTRHLKWLLTGSEQGGG